MSELKWTTEIPTVQGWYWVKWRLSGLTELYYFDGSEWDTHQLESRGERFYGPLQPPEYNQ